MMQSYQRKRRRKVAEINVVPYIDVMLVLLIIFMAAAPIVAQGVKVDLPQGKSQPIPTESKPPLVASVNKAGEYFLDNGSVDKGKAILLDDLAAIVVAELRVDPNRPVVVNGDRDVSYDQVVQLMIVLSNAGVPSVGLMTQSDE